MDPPGIRGGDRIQEWTADDHFRHARFAALPDDKDPKDLCKERWRLAGGARHRSVGRPMSEAWTWRLSHITSIETEER